MSSRARRGTATITPSPPKETHHSTRNSRRSVNALKDGIIAVVKRDCPTCNLVVPALQSLDQGLLKLDVYVQDDPSYSEGLSRVIDDHDLEASYRLDIETVPTLIRMRDGKETSRVVGWNRDEWREFAGIADLGEGLPDIRPGCGSKTRDPGMPSKLTVRYGDTGLTSRKVEIPYDADPIEAFFDRGWTDGLPVVPPTQERVLEMLTGTSRAPSEIVGIVPPNLVPCSVEKVAINAVMAGCKPEYMPVILTAVECACKPEFNLHGILATTNSVAPAIMVNGPIAKAIGMNSKGNVFGQGNRANATIGRTLQLIVRNVGGGRPREIDRSCFGSPAKFTFCFAEDDEDPRWESYSVSLGYSPQTSTVTMFSGDGISQIVDHISRTPEDLCKTLAGCLRAVYNPGHVIQVQAFLAVGGEHQNLFYEAGWSKQRVKEELDKLLMIPLREIYAGRSGYDGLRPEQKLDPNGFIPKFNTGPLNIIRAGGSAGKFSAIIPSVGGWKTIRQVTSEIKP
jgi:hypothetical protein